MAWVGGEPEDGPPDAEDRGHGHEEETGDQDGMVRINKQEHEWMWEKQFLKQTDGAKEDGIGVGEFKMDE